MSTPAQAAVAPAPNAPSGRVDDALDASVIETLRLVAPAEGTILTLSTLLHLGGLLSGEAPMPGVMLGFAGVCFVATLLLWRGRVPARFAHPTAALLVGMAIAASGIGLHAEPSVTKLVGVSVIILGSSVIFLSMAWLMAAVGAAWLVVALALGTAPAADIQIGAMLVPLASATLVALSIGVTRRRSNLRYEHIRRSDAAQRELLERREHELRGAIADLQVSRMRYQELFERVPMGIYRATLDGRFIEANQTAMRLLGLSDRGAMLRTSFDAFFADAAEGRERRDRLLADGALQGFVFRARRVDGVELWLRNNATLMRDAGGNVLYCEGVLEDVTSLRMAEENLNKTRQQMARNDKLAALGTLVAGVAHEVNNPLTYIRGNVEILQADLACAVQEGRGLDEGLTNEALTMTKQVLQGVDRIGHITKSLKLVARDSSRARRIESLNDTVEGVVAVAQSRIKKDVPIHVALDARGLASVDAGEIAQVMLNLVFNAIDAVDGRPGGLVEVRTRDEGDRVVVEVADNGVGIPADQEGRIFTPFHTTKAEGMGLGLSVSHSIVTEHGGELSFVSEPGRGTRFQIVLPAATPASKLSTPAR